jgi:hypothetical protein
MEFFEGFAHKCSKQIFHFTNATPSGLLTPRGIIIIAIDRQKIFKTPKGSDIIIFAK